MWFRNFFTGVLLLLSVVGIVYAADDDSSKTEEKEEVVFVDIDGVERRISDYKGKWVVVNFWATWCPPCREEMPDLVDFHNRHKDKDAVVLGIHFDEAPEKQVRAFMREYHVSYPIIPMASSFTSPIGPVPGLPTTYIFGPDGTKLARQTGPITSGMIESYMARKATEMKSKE